MKNKLFLTRALFLTLVMSCVLFAAGFYSTDINPVNKSGERVESHRFTSGDSILEITIDPGYDAYIEAYDSAGSGTDTFKAYITAIFSDGAMGTSTNTLAYLSKVNDTSSVSLFYTPTQSNGVIIPGASTTVFYKTNYAAGKLTIVRSNAANLTDVSWVTVRTVPRAKGALMNSHEIGMNIPEKTKFNFGLRPVLKL